MADKDMKIDEKCIRFYFDYVYHFKGDDDAIKCFIEMLDCFSEKEHEVIFYRHGLEDGVAKAIGKVASNFNISEHEVEMIEFSTLLKLHLSPKSEYLKEHEKKDPNIFLVYRDYFPSGMIIQDLIEKAEK